MKITQIKVTQKCALLLLLIMLSVPTVRAQLVDYNHYYSQPIYSVDKTEDLVYGIGATNYYLFNGFGDQNRRSNYNLITQQTLTLDLYQPQMASSLGKRAVLILVPGSGRNGCITAGACTQDTVRQRRLSTSDAHYIVQEGDNYNELDDRTNRARNFARRGLVVVSPVTRYQYQNRQIDNANSYKWRGDNGGSLFNGVSTHLEPLVVDLKRVIRWLSKPENAAQYNIDPQNIFILGGSGASKMASLATITATDVLLTDDPAQLNPDHADYQFEVTNNHLLEPQLPIRGAIMFAGDTNGTRNLRLMEPGTGDFMFWHGTTDRSILHGMAETIEEKCENIGCRTQFYSLPGVEHRRTGRGTSIHTNSDEAVGFTAHVHDFIVNHVKRAAVDDRPTISISSERTKFNEANGVARIEVVLSKPADQDIRFTMAADQMREVTRENGVQGRYNLIEKFVANDRSSTGPVMYDQSTGVAFELQSNLPASFRNLDNHTRGPGQGNSVVIPQGNNYFYDDFVGKKQRMTIPQGETSAVFRVTLVNDTLVEQNECFKVRLLNAQGGVRMENTVETIVINDDDNPDAESSFVCENVSSVQSRRVVDTPALEDDDERPNNPRIDDESPSEESIPSISIREAMFTSEKSGVANIRVRADRVLTQDVVLRYRTKVGSARSRDGDYVYADKNVTIRAGRDRVFIRIAILDDSVDEGREDFFVKLMGVSSGNAAITNDTAQVVIVPNN